MVSTAAFHARVRGSVPGLGGFKETKMFLPHPRVKVSIVGSLRDREVACSASDRQGSNFESCVWRTVSSQSSHHPQEVLLAQFSLYVHKGGLKPDSFHFFVHSSDIICPVLGKCRLSIYVIGAILCKYYANTDRSSQQTREIEPIVILVHSLQRCPNIIPPLVQCLVFSGARLRRTRCCNKCDS